MDRRQLLTGIVMLAGGRASLADAPGPPHDPLHRVALSEDARYAVTIGESGMIHVWKTEIGEMPYALPASWGASAEFSPDSRYLATSHPSGVEGKVALRETATGKVLWEEQSRGSSEFQFAPDGKSLLIVTALPTRRLAFSVGMVEVPSGKALWPPLGRMWDRAQLAISADSNTVAVEAREEGKPVVQLQDARRGTVRLRMPVETWVGGLMFSPDGKLLAVGLGGGQVELRDTGSGRLHCRLAEVPLGQVAQVPELRFSPDGKWLATAPVVQDRADRAGPLRMWDTKTGAALPALPEAAGMLQPVFSPDSSLVAGIRLNGLVGVWEVKSGLLRHTLGTPEKPAATAIGQVRFTPDGSHLVAVTALGIRRWETRTGKQSESFPFR